MKTNLLSRVWFLSIVIFLQVVLYTSSYGQSAITAISTSSSNAATVSETSINGAGYSFSLWLVSSAFSVNYSSAASGDITSVNSFNTATVSGLQPVPITAIANVKRVANATITDNRNFIASWNKVSSNPLSGAVSGTFNCVAPKVTSMQAALLTNNINSGYDNVFQNTTSNPHYNNIERIDYVIPGGISATSNISQIGFPIFDRGTGDPFKIAAITSIDASNNPTGYSTLFSVTAANFSPAGLLGAAFNYTIFVSDPNVAAGQHRPSVLNSQDIRGVFISFQNLGIALNQMIYGYSLFGPDVVTPTHTLTNPSTFPTNTDGVSMLDLVNVMGVYKSIIVTIIPLKLISFKAAYEGNGVKLTWATAFEQNLSNFIIEKSANGQQWDPLSIVPATNQTEGWQYQYFDINITADKNYYRLKIVNEDGSVEYSPVRLIANGKTGAALVKYDNSSNRLFVSSNRPVKEITVLSSIGQTIQVVAVASNVNSIEIALKKMPPGIYFIRVDEADVARSTSRIAVY